MSVEDYIAVLESDPAETLALGRDLLIQVTQFFRDPETFEALTQTVFPRLVAANEPAGSLRIWVPGCSTGEEVYSIAICLMEYLGERAATMPVQIFGTDVSTEALETARTGRYIENIARNVSPERLARFFVRDGEYYCVDKAVRELCTFSRHDVVSDPPFSRMDLVSCRNLLIYLSAAAQRSVMPFLSLCAEARRRADAGTFRDGGHFPGALWHHRRNARFQTNAERTIGTCLYALGDGQWNIPSLRELLEKLLPRRILIRDFQITHDFPRIGARTMRLNAARVIGRAHALILLTMEDITQHQLAVERLETADHQKDELLAMLAHELRNPLAAIGNGLEVWGSENVDQQTQQRARAAARRQLDHEIGLVSDLLDVSRITRGIINLNVAPVDLAQTVQHGIATLRAEIDAHQHELVLSLPASQAVVVEGDAMRLEQIVTNLLGNAIKYTPPGGRIEVSLARDGGEAVLTAADNGIGMTADFLPRPSLASSCRATARWTASPRVWGWGSHWCISWLNCIMGPCRLRAMVLAAAARSWSGFPRCRRRSRCNAPPRAWHERPPKPLHKGFSWWTTTPMRPRARRWY